MIRLEERGNFSSYENSKELHLSGLAEDHGRANPIDLRATILST